MTSLRVSNDVTLSQFQQNNTEIESDKSISFRKYVFIIEKEEGACKPTISMLLHPLKVRY